jgi:hypothetical protein
MDFKSLLSMLGPKDDPLGDYTKQTIDRFKMAGDPTLQGPHLPKHTPEEDKYFNGMTAAVAGSINPVAGKIEVPALANMIRKLGGETAEKASVMFGDNARTAAARAMADDVAKVGTTAMAENPVTMDQMKRAQQKLSRAVDFQQRNKK